MPLPFEPPAFYDSADAVSAAEQRRYMGAIAVRLVALVLAALGGAIPWMVDGVEPLVWLSVVAFVVAVGAELFLLQFRPDEGWYEARAAAESVKTVAWRFAVGGNPFPTTDTPVATVARFSTQVASLTQDLRSVTAPGATGGHITPSMTALRAAPFDARRATYVEGRIEDQIAWYGRKARRNTTLQNRFIGAAIVLEAAGIVGAVVRLTTGAQIDLLGILAALTAGVASWAQTRQYGQLSRAYAVAGHELTTIRTQATTVTEADWPDFVDESENAISREHTLWRASRGPRP